MDRANFPPILPQKTYTKHFHQNIGNPVSRQSEGAGKSSPSSHQTATQDTQIQKATKF